MTTDARAVIQFDVFKKSAGVAYLLWFFFGSFGGHRFYLDRSGSAAAMLIITVISLMLMIVLVGFITIWITWNWWIVDAFLIPGMIREFNGSLAARLG